MKFFQKRSVAWIITICMILAAVFIGKYKQQQNAYMPSRETEAEQWAWKNYTAYDRYIHDEAKSLSDYDRKQLSVYNASSDYTYDVVCGIWILEQTPDATLEDVADKAVEELQLSSRDLVLVLDMEQRAWYLGRGSVIPEDSSHTLELMLNETSGELFTSPGKGFLKLFSNLSQWYGSYMTPLNAVNHVFQLIGRTVGNILLVSLLIAVAVIGGIVYVCIKLCKRGGSSKNGHRDGEPHVRRASERNLEHSETQYTSVRQQQKNQDPS